MDGKRRQPETVYLITSPPPDQATPARLLAWNRGCWGAVENGIHYALDVALREDHCGVRKGALPRVMAALANLAISILRLFRVRNIKRRMEQLHLRPDSTVGLVACQSRPASPVASTRRPARRHKLTPSAPSRPSLPKSESQRLCAPGSPSTRPLPQFPETLIGRIESACGPVKCWERIGRWGVAGAFRDVFVGPGHCSARSLASDF